MNNGFGQESFGEIRLLIESFELKNTVFRSDHVSNYLVLKGNLCADKQARLDTTTARMAARALTDPASIENPLTLLC